jgi:cytochrome c oxidase subunit 2
MWTLLPGLLLVFLFLISARAMAEAAAEPKDARRVQVVARQFLWEFAYQDAGLKTTNDLRVPVGQPVVLELTSGDVIHSFWVPDLAGKVDANPGITTKLTFTAERAGQYRGVCTELCGVGHASMLFTVTAMEPPEFEAWLQGGGGAPVAAAPAAAGPAAADIARAKQLMMDKGCGACHKIAGVDGLTGAVGPELSKVGSVAGQRKPGTSAEAYLNESIANPTAFVVQGFPPVMPQIPMSDDEHSTIVKYLLTLK